MSELTDLTPLGVAKEWLRERLKEGAACPLCSQRAQLYRRSINSGMARGLINQYRAAGTEYVHTRRLWLPVTKEGAQLQWWGLIEQAPARRPDGGQVGYWRVTERGEAFLRNGLRVPKIIVVYDKRIMDIEDGPLDPTWSIRDALGKKFNLDELLRGDE